METKLITFSNLEWFIINETEKEKLLLLRDSLTSEQIAKYFLEKEMVDREYVKFNNKQTPWWDESYIRKILNSSFLSDLDKSSLNQMKTTLELNGKSRITEDYVRLLTYEEAKNLPQEIRKTEREYGYCTLSPYYFDGANAYVFRVFGSRSLGYLGFSNVSNTYAVRPVISLKSDNMESPIRKLSKEEIIKKLIRAREG